MQYVLHITNRCNFRCSYCGLPKGEQDMAFETARSVCEMAFRHALCNRERTTCISFYGGEPLLCRDLIERVIGHCIQNYAGKGVEFHFRMTTNGVLLDGEFARYARQNHIKLALSIDGTENVHDLYRIDKKGAPTFERVLRAARIVLNELPNTPAMATVNPDTAPMLLESVRSLHNAGFETIVTTPNFTVAWSDAQIDALARQYKALADWYGDMLLSGVRVKLPVFDEKFIGHLAPEIGRNKCVPGAHRLSIALDGSIYPCTQYVRYPEFQVGEYRSGIDQERLDSVREQTAQGMFECRDCALNARCDNRCGCKNLASTGCVNRTSATVCAHERALIPIADHLGERIFQ